MPTNWTKHAEEAEIIIGADEFMGGMNISASPESLENQVPFIENMYYDASSGRLRTRYPFKRYSTAVTSGTTPKITGIIHFDNEFHITSLASTTHTLFYLDSALAPVSIGALNGVGYPSFQPYATDLCIATGSPNVASVPEEVTTARSLTDIANAPTSAITLLEQDGQLALVGDTTYPDTYFESEVQDKDTWSGGTSEQLSCGWQHDDVVIHGMVHAAYGHIILFKKGRSRKEVWLINPTANDPYAKLIAEDLTAHTHRCAARAAGALWIADKVQGPIMLKGTDALEKVVIDPESLEIGQRILKLWSISDDAWMCVYPPHSQIWICPKPATNNWIWILNYRSGSWVRFKPAGTLSFYSAYWHPDDGYLYLGGSDGFVYRYTTDDSATLTDESGGVSTNYPQRVNSKIYNLFPYHKHEIKAPFLTYRSLASGSGKFRIYDDYGYNLILSEDLTIPVSYVTLYDYRATTLWEKRAETLYKQSIKTQWIQQNCEADNFQFQFEINSGGIELHSIVSQIAKVRKI